MFYVCFDMIGFLFVSKLFRLFDSTLFFSFIPSERNIRVLFILILVTYDCSLNVNLGIEGK